jgi:hypothetical protein
MEGWMDGWMDGCSSLAPELLDGGPLQSPPPKHKFAILFGNCANDFDYFSEVYGNHPPT